MKKRLASVLVVAVWVLGLAVILGLLAVSLVWDKVRFNF